MYIGTFLSKFFWLHIADTGRMVPIKFSLRHIALLKILWDKQLVFLITWHHLSFNCSELSWASYKFNHWVLWATSLLWCMEFSGMVTDNYCRPFSAFFMAWCQRVCSWRKAYGLQRALFRDLPLLIYIFLFPYLVLAWSPSIFGMALYWPTSREFKSCWTFTYCTVCVKMYT